MRDDTTGSTAKREDSAVGMALLALLTVIGAAVFCFFPVM